MSTFTASSLIYVTLWPIDKKSDITLLDPFGEVLAVWPVSSPILGREVSRFMPEGCFIETSGMFVGSLTGELNRNTRIQFDTDVSTERGSMSVEDRMARLEGKLVQSERRELRLKQENQKQKDMKNAENDLEPVVDIEHVSDTSADAAIKPTGGDSGA